MLSPFLFFMHCCAKPHMVFRFHCTSVLQCSTISFMHCCAKTHIVFPYTKITSPGSVFFYTLLCVQYIPHMVSAAPPYIFYCENTLETYTKNIKDRVMTCPYHSLIFAHTPAEIKLKTSPKLTNPQ